MKEARRAPTSSFPCFWIDNTLWPTTQHFLSLDLPCLISSCLVWHHWERLCLVHRWFDVPGSWYPDCELYPSSCLWWVLCLTNGKVTTVTLKLKRKPEIDYYKETRNIGHLVILKFWIILKTQSTKKKSRFKEKCLQIFYMSICITILIDSLTSSMDTEIVTRNCKCTQLDIEA